MTPATEKLALGLSGESGQTATNPEVCAAYSVDGITPACVLYPRSAEDAAAMLLRASRQDLAVIPCRNATKLHIGNPSRRYDAALCLKEMNQVWHCEPDDLTASVEPGIKFGDLQRYLGRYGLWIPLDPAGGGKASLGGIVAANSAGPLRLRYGSPRDMVLGMKIATTEGKLVKTGGRVVKNVAGYDVGKLLTGSFGTLGVVVEISLKLFPLPSKKETWVAELPSLDAARALRRGVLDSPLSPLRMVLLSGTARWARGEPALGAQENPEIWIEFGGSERVLRRCAETLGEVAGSVGAPPRLLDNDAAESCWERISDFDATARRASPQPLILKAAVPIAATESFIEQAASESESPRVIARFLAHNGIVCVSGEQHESADFSGWIASLRAIASRLGGTLVVERCAAELKKQIDVWGPPGDDFGLMRKLKELWDPKGVLSPGRFVGGL